MPKQIFTVYSCDILGNDDSMRLIMCTYSKRKLKSFIIKKISQGVFEYGDDNLSITKQVAMFKNDFEKNTRNVINSKLWYGRFDYCYDGEEI